MSNEAQPVADQYHGQGGSYRIENGQRVLVARTAAVEPAPDAPAPDVPQANTDIHAEQSAVVPPQLPPPTSKASNLKGFK